MTRLCFLALPTVFATYMPFCAAPVHPTAAPVEARREMAELWRQPSNVASADVVYGPWGREHAPDRDAMYTFAHAKTHGVSPGMTIRDPKGREWSMKIGDEGQVEVVVSRVLSALGYHQPPVYYLQHINLTDSHGTGVRPGGRLRPKDKAIKDEGDWSWQQNPFVGTKPYQGLLVLLAMLDSSDLKNSNNSLYKLKEPREGAKEWYVVRDVGTGLGETGRLDPKRNDADLFAHQKFVKAVRNGFVEFDYRGYHQELFRDRITVDDVKWACDLASRLTDRQWTEVFRYAGYEDETAARFIGSIKQRIAEGRSIGQQSAANRPVTKP